MAKFRWAYLGCGGIAHTTAKQLKDSADNEIVAVWNRTLRKAEDFAKKFGGKVYATAEEAITAPDVDGVYIALTPDRHAEYMQLCIKHKKAVMCEKPFAVNATQAEQVIREAKEAGVYVSEAMWTWHTLVNAKPSLFEPEMAADGRLMRGTVFGKGVIPVKEIYERMRADGYSGTFAIEYIRPKSGCCSLQEHKAHLKSYIKHLM